MSSVPINGTTEISEYQASVERSPRDPDAHFYYGDKLEQAGNLDAAIEQFRIAVNLPPKDVGRAARSFISAAAQGSSVSKIPF